MPGQQAGYQAYLLRLWRTAERHCRATLEDPHTGEQRAFATLDQLAAYLARAMQSDCAQTEPGVAHPGESHVE
jgi:hypothetical protein